MSSSHTLSPDDLTKAQGVITDAFRSHREELLSVMGHASFERKGDASPVTHWDRLVEDSLKNQLQSLWPNVGFVGEESGAAGAHDAYWLVDPIDGTSSFIRGLEYCTNMAAYVEGGVVKASVIYDFVRDDVYTAQLGGGAFKNGQRLRVNTERREGDLAIYTFFTNKFSLLQEAFIALRMKLLLPVGASGHAYTQLAQGRIDGIVSLSADAKAYDIAPGFLLATEAGAEVFALDEMRDGVHRQFVIGSPYVVERVEQSGLL